MWKIILIIAVVVIAVIIVGKVASGLQGIWKILCFPFVMIYNLIHFIFKK